MDSFIYKQIIRTKVAYVLKTFIVKNRNATTVTPLVESAGR
jgi:hypothetical protein